MDITKVTRVKGVTELFPENIEQGEVKINNFEFSTKKDPMFNLRAMRDGGAMFRMYDGKYVRLRINGETVMSDTFMERQSNSDFIENANGKVFIAGLGLGMIIHNILDKDSITEIIVIEKNQNVIDIVGSKFTDPRVKIIYADIFKYDPPKEEKYDTIYFDIWTDIDIENLKEIKLLHNKYKNRLNRANPLAWMNSWMKEYLQGEKRKDDRRRMYYY
jgi:hypothetical protein